MKYVSLIRITVFMSVFAFIVSCQKVDDFLIQNESIPIEENILKSVETDIIKSAKKSKGFVHGLAVDIDGEAYYFAGPPDGANGENDVPGHYWVQAGHNKVVGKHYNTGPFGAANWWSSDADDGAYLYKVHGIIDTWSVDKATYYASRGYVHRHEFVSVATGDFHPNKVVWLKHTAVTSFTLDGGPGAPNPPYEHYVTPGVDLEFPNNGFVPYPEI